MYTEFTEKLKIQCHILLLAAALRPVGSRGKFLIGYNVGLGSSESSNKNFVNSHAPVKRG